MSMFEEQDLFSLFGIERPKENDGMKKESQKKAVKTPKKGGQQELVSPFTIYSGCYEPFVINTEEKLSKDLLINKWRELHPEYTDALLDFTVDGKNTAYACFKENTVISKGMVKLNVDSCLTYAGHEYDLSSIMTDTVCEVDIAELQKLVYAETPEFGTNSAFYYDKGAGSIIPKPVASKTGKVQNIVICIPGREEITLDETEKTEFIKGTPDKAGFFEADEGKLKSFVIKKFPEFKNRLNMVFNNGKFVVTMVASVKADTKSSTKKYPTDAQISLIYTRIELSPEMFGGKTEVSDTEILRYLSRDYPEYSKERTRIEYDEKNKLIIPILKSSTKGALISVKEQQNLENREYKLEKSDVAGYRVRKETLPFATFLVAEAKSEECNPDRCGKIEYYLPKIPGKIYALAEAFFAYVAEKYNTEAMLQVFWNRENREYELYCPVQQCTYTNVSCERDYLYESKNWLILDIHSHGNICCTFSGTDDRDECGTRFYGVFYDHAGKDGFKFDLRAGCGGIHIPVKFEDIFSCAEHMDYKMQDFSAWEEKLEVYQ